MIRYTPERGLYRNRAARFPDSRTREALTALVRRGPVRTPDGVPVTLPALAVRTFRPVPQQAIIGRGIQLFSAHAALCRCQAEFGKTAIYYGARDERINPAPLPCRRTPARRGTSLRALHLEVVSPPPATVPDRTGRTAVSFAAFLSSCSILSTPAALTGGCPIPVRSHPGTGTVRRRSHPAPTQARQCLWRR